MLVETVIGAPYEVSNVLGSGFVEKLYERDYSKNSSSAIFRPLSRHPSRWCTKGSTLGCIRRIWW